MIALRVCYWVLAIVLSVTGLWNSLALSSHRKLIDGQGRRLNLIERARERIRDRVVRSDETADDAEPSQLLINSHLLDRIESLEQQLRDRGK